MFLTPIKCQNVPLDFKAENETNIRVYKNWEGIEYASFKYKNFQTHLNPNVDTIV